MCRTCKKKVCCCQPIFVVRPSPYIPVPVFPVYAPVCSAPVVQVGWAQYGNFWYSC